MPIGERARGPRAGAGRRYAGGWLVALLAFVLSGCGLDPWSERESGEPLVDSAANASMQTYGLMLLNDRREQRAAERATPAEARPQPARQLAALPPADDPGIALRVSFATDSSDLSPLARASLSDLGRQLSAQPDTPVKLLAYWAGEGEGEESNAAKLRALKRALVVREFLTDQGIRSPPIEFPRVQDPDRPLDVVDVVVAGS